MLSIDFLRKMMFLKILIKVIDSLLIVISLYIATNKCKKTKLNTRFLVLISFYYFKLSFIFFSCFFCFKLLTSFYIKFFFEVFSILFWIYISNFILYYFSSFNSTCFYIFLFFLLLFFILIFENIILPN